MAKKKEGATLKRSKITYTQCLLNDSGFLRIFVGYLARSGRKTCILKIII